MKVEESKVGLEYRIANKTMCSLEGGDAYLKGGLA